MFRGAGLFLVWYEHIDLEARGIEFGSLNRSAVGMAGTEAAVVQLASSAAPTEAPVGDVQIVDGHILTFEGLGVMVRLHGIDAPGKSGLRVGQG